MEAEASEEALAVEVSVAVDVPEVHSAAADPAASVVLTTARTIPLITVRISVRFGTVRATTAEAVALAQ